MVRRITLLLALVGCGGNSIDDCKQLLDQSDVVGAAECCANVDTPQGAFCYGLTRLALWPNQPDMQQMFAALHQTGWHTDTDLFGAHGWMHDTMQSWSGTATLSLGGSTLALDRVRAGTNSDGTIAVYARSSLDPRLAVTIDEVGSVPFVDVEGPASSTYGNGGGVNITSANGRATGTVDVMLMDGTHLTGSIDAPLTPCLSLSRRAPFQVLRSAPAWDDLVSVFQGTTMAAMFDHAAATAPYLDDVAKAFEKAAAAPDFEFTIPKGLFFGARDLVVRRPEAALLAAAVRGLQFWLLFLDAYDWNISGASGQAFTDSLNAHFFYVADAQKFGASRGPYDQMAKDLSTALDAMAAEGPAPAGAFSQWTAAPGFDLLRSFATMLAQVPTGQPAIPNTNPATQVDLSGMFGSQPLDGQPLAHDPFVYEVDSVTGIGHIYTVEGFWRDLLTARFSPDFISSMAPPAFPSPNPFGSPNIASMPDDTRAQLQLFTTASSLGCN